MPDNPHPHPPEFTASNQLFLVALINLIKARITSLTQTTVTAQSAGNRRFSTTFFTRSPGDT